MRIVVLLYDWLSIVNIQKTILFLGFYWNFFEEKEELLIPNWGLLYIEIGVFYLILYVAGSCKQYGEKKKTGKFLVDFPAFLDKLTWLFYQLKTSFQEFAQGFAF